MVDDVLTIFEDALEEINPATILSIISETSTSNDVVRAVGDVKGLVDLAKGGPSAVTLLSLLRDR